MKNRQQSFATFAVTGETPKKSKVRRTAMTENFQSSPQTESLFAMAIAALSNSQSMHDECSIAMLEFVAAAQSYRPWITDTIRKHPSFIKTISDFLGNLTTKPGKAAHDQADELHAASLVTEILAMYLHNMRQLGDTSFIKSISTSISYLTSHGVSLPPYNTSLHANLKRNFEKRYPGCSLSNFKRALPHMAFGGDFYYAMDFSAEALGFDSAWNGPKNGFAEELTRANVNLSLVEARIRLTGSWKSLAIELSLSMEQEKPLQRYMANTVYQCLLAITIPIGSEAIFQSLVETRIELARSILQRLVGAKSTVPVMFDLVSAAWDAIKASGEDLELAIVGADASRYRSLLQILLLTLQPHAATSELPAPSASAIPRPDSPGSSSGRGGAHAKSSGGLLLLFTDIVAEVVGKCFRSLATQIHENPADIPPSDFALITAIFQTILHVRKISTVHNSLTHHLCDSNVQRYTLALFSWSDRLLAADDDPVFGDLSISFLRELSSIPQMAEYLATEGTLGQLSTAPLLSHMRQRASGYGPSDHPRRLHTIWSRGVLPLCLNILVAVGESFAGEATAFLNSFSGQLARAGGAFGSKAGTSTVTLDVATEIHTLAMIALALDHYRASPSAVAIAGGEIPELAWNRAVLKDDLEGFVNGSGMLGARIMPGTEREVELSRAPAVGGVGVGAGVGSRLEELVLGELKGALVCLGG